VPIIHVWDHLVKKSGKRCRKIKSVPHGWRGRGTVAGNKKEAEVIEVSHFAALEVCGSRTDTVG